MGNTTTRVNQNPNPVVTRTELSELYVACSNNDIDRVRDLLATTPFEEINTHEINGSTALHRAVESGHTDIVRLLLHDYEVCRHRLNAQGRTAFESASTDEIRQSFQRASGSGSRCFSETVTPEQLNIIDTNQKDQPPSAGGWVQGEPYFLEIRKHHMEHVRAYYGSRRKPSLKISNERWIKNHRDIFMALINQSLTPKNRIYPKIEMLLREFAETGRPEPLIRLFTLETHFYGIINQNKASSEQLAEPIYNALSFLTERGYTGQAFRGLALTREAIADYHWAANVSSRVLIFNTFSSMSRSLAVAEEFAYTRAHPPTIPVIMTFVFPKKCFTAIQLYRVSPTLPALSENEDEQEILILPRTVFYVTKVDETETEARIYLEHCSWLDNEAEEYNTELARTLAMY